MQTIIDFKTKEIVGRCTKKEFKEQFKSIKELFNDLQNLKQGV